MIRLKILIYLSLATSLGFPLGAIAQSPPSTEDVIPPTLPDNFPQPLPSQDPEPTPSPNLQTPSLPETSECISTTEGDRFLVERVEVLGSTVLQQEIAALIKPFANNRVTFEELVCLRSQITDLYIANGYINSGAFLPNNQDLTSGIVQIQVVEGELERIEINGLDRLQESYVRSRLERGAGKPLNQQRLEEALQLLQLDPLLERVNAELTAGTQPGQSILIVNLEEAPAGSRSVLLEQKY